jgi:hypothetical protein
VASQTRPSASEEERRQKVRTIVVATIASATAAVVTSQFWIAGTWMAAALTPVLVTLISEMLHKPTAAIASRLTTEKDAILPEAGGAGRPPPRDADEALPARAPAEPGSREAEPAEPPIRVYRTGGGGPARPRARKKIAVGVIAATAAIAFAITAVAMTGTELITGGSIGKGSHRTTLLGGSKDNTKDSERPDATTPTGERDQQQTTPREQRTAPDDQQTTPKKTQQQQTTPEEQQQTTPAPTPQVPPTTTTP